MKSDRQATEAAQFLDPRSYVTKDQREVLYGRDWKARKRELLERCKGRCEADCRWRDHNVQRCRSEAADPHHKIRRSVSRDDRLSNLLALCRFHHNLLDERRIRSDRAERRTA